MSQLDVRETEMVTFIYLDIDNIVVLWYDVASKAALHKVYLVNLVILFVDVFELVAFHEFQEGADPAYELSVLILEESNI